MYYAVSDQVTGVGYVDLHAGGYRWSKGGVMK